LETPHTPLHPKLQMRRRLPTPKHETPTRMMITLTQEVITFTQKRSAPGLTAPRNDLLILPRR
jgi:hypothetical protein